MTKLLDQALEAARDLPPHAQDEIARLVLQLAGQESYPTPTLSADEQAAIAISRAAAKRGDYASDDDVRAVWTRFRP